MVKDHALATMANMQTIFLSISIDDFPPARSAGMNDCVSRVCVIIGWEWDGIGIGMAIPGGAACAAGIGDPNPKT